MIHFGWVHWNEIPSKNDRIEGKLMESSSFLSALVVNVIVVGFVNDTLLLHGLHRCAHKECIHLSTALNDFSELSQRRRACKKQRNDNIKKKKFDARKTNTNSKKCTETVAEWEKENKRKYSLHICAQKQRGNRRIEEKKAKRSYKENYCIC